MQVAHVHPLSQRCYKRLPRPRRLLFTRLRAVALDRLCLGVAVCGWQGLAASMLCLGVAVRGWQSLATSVLLLAVGRIRLLGRWYVRRPVGWTRITAATSQNPIQL
ncbi:MAG: hypothetical protein QF828_06745 [Pseudomonadales bacterium]|nr:hypothetical protein [Pseudomonadales bacterium]